MDQSRGVTRQVLHLPTARHTFKEINKNQKGKKTQDIRLKIGLALFKTVVVLVAVDCQKNQHQKVTLELDIYERWYQYFSCFTSFGHELYSSHTHLWIYFVVSLTF